MNYVTALKAVPHMVAAEVEAIYAGDFTVARGYIARFSTEISTLLA
jgi:hypothetical protein